MFESFQAFFFIWFTSLWETVCFDLFLILETTLTFFSSQEQSFSIEQWNIPPFFVLI